MNRVLPVCLYTQYYCCPAHKDCRLYHLCSQLPKKPFVANSKQYRFVRPVPLDKAEIRKHQEKYRFYNCLFGDLKEKTREYCKRNHEYRMEYQRQYRARKNAKSEFDSVLFTDLCDKNCAACKNKDCILPSWNNKKEYDALYYKKFSDIKIERSREYYKNNRQKCLAYLKEYRQKHREELLLKRQIYYQKNKDKLNAKKRYKYYQKKGYIMSECILKETTNPDYEQYEGTFGTLTIVPFNKQDYISFISLDREFSFRAEIDKRLNDLSNPLCKEAWYTDTNGYEYTFESTVNQGNPLWEMEHNDNFVRCSNDQ